MYVNKPFSRLLAMLLCVVMMLGTAPITAIAEGTDSGTSLSNSNCTHVHDGSCSYVEGVDCAHAHDAECGYAEAAPCGHQHDTGCSYAVAVPCDHRHDEHCGGIAPSLSLGYSVTAFDSLPSDVAAQSVPLGTTMRTLALPDMLDATGEADNAQPEAITIHGVTWLSAPDYEPDTAGTYSFTAVLPQGYDLAVGVSLPVIDVTVGQSITFDLPLNDSNENAFHLPEKEPITEADLLDGVSATDETGDPVAVTVQDTDGLDMTAPQMRGVYPNPPYIITYAATHPVTGDVFTKTRELYVTLGLDAIMPTVSVSDYAALQTTCSATNGDTTVTLAADITDGAEQLTIGRSLTLDLAGRSLTITLPDSSPGGRTSNGIKLSSGVTLTIKDSATGGKLTVTNEATSDTTTGNGAAISTTEGTLIIQSGEVLATGGRGGAGIGGGFLNGGGNITIEGGTVTAKGQSGTNNGGAGIGGGNGYDSTTEGNFGGGGNIAITGGTVVAHGGYRAAGIGGGCNGEGGIINISGSADVTAKGGTGGAGIGSGKDGEGGEITISSGTVNATGGAGESDDSHAVGGGAGIGSAGGNVSSSTQATGESPASGDITISGTANVTATGGDGSFHDDTYTGHAGAGIGSGGAAGNGPSGNLTNIDITSSDITATGGGGSGVNAGAAIGTGGSANGPGKPAATFDFHSGALDLAAPPTDWIFKTSDFALLDTAGLSFLAIRFEPVPNPDSKGTNLYPVGANSGNGELAGLVYSDVNGELTVPTPLSTHGLISGHGALPPGDYKAIISFVDDIASPTYSYYYEVFFSVTRSTGYNLTVVSGTGGGNYTAGAQATITANAAPSGKVFDKWTGGNGGTFENAYSASTTFTMPGNAATVTATYKNDDSGNNNNNSSRADGDSSSSSDTPAPATTWLERSPAATLAAGAKRRGENYARTRITGIYGVRGNSWDRLSGLRYEHDTMDGGAVQVRVYIKTPERLTKDTRVSGYVKGSEVDKVRGIFEKWFKNKVRVIHFDHPGAWGQPVEIAAKVDLTGMDTENLHFYSYDKAANSYRRIEKPAYWIDTNGYLRFTTEYAGDIIISDGPLAKK